MAAHKRLRVIRMLFCDFCGRSHTECELLIKGRDEVHICDQCATVVLGMVLEEKEKRVVESPLLADAVGQR